MLPSRNSDAKTAMSPGTVEFVGSSNAHVQEVVKAAAERSATTHTAGRDIVKRIGTIKQTIVGLANIFGDDWLGEELLELVGRKGRPRRDAMIIAIKQGYAILAAGGTSLDAVETTIRFMEDSGLFDAGRGSYYTRAGVPEMDAARHAGWPRCRRIRKITRNRTGLAFLFLRRARLGVLQESEHSIFGHLAIDAVAANWFADFSGDHGLHMSPICLRRRQ